MRDLKRQPKQSPKVRQNKRKQKKKPLYLRKLLRRMLRVGVMLSSLALLLVGGFLAIQLTMASDLFRIAEICVAGGQHLNRDEVISLADIRPGLNTFELDLELIGRKIAENPWVRNARVDRIFPRQLEVSVEERKAKAIINLGYLYYMDNHGEVFKVLDAEDSLDFPVITGFDYQKVEEHDPQTAAELKQIVALLEDLAGRQKFGLKQISEIHRGNSGELSLYTLAGAVRVKLGHGSFTQKLDRLERIYSQLQPRLPILDYIDLNVDDKVIVRIERTASAAKG